MTKHDSKGGGEASPAAQRRSRLLFQDFGHNYMNAAAIESTIRHKWLIQFGSKSNRTNYILMQYDQFLV